MNLPYHFLTQGSLTFKHDDRNVDVIDTRCDGFHALTQAHEVLYLLHVIIGIDLLIASGDEGSMRLIQEAQRIFRCCERVVILLVIALPGLSRVTRAAVVAMTMRRGRSSVTLVHCDFDGVANGSGFFGLHEPILHHSHRKFTSSFFGFHPFPFHINERIALEIGFFAIQTPFGVHAKRMEGENVKKGDLFVHVLRTEWKVDVAQGVIDGSGPIWVGRCLRKVFVVDNGAKVFESGVVHGDYFTPWTTQDSSSAGFRHGCLLALCLRELYELASIANRHPDTPVHVPG